MKDSPVKMKMMSDPDTGVKSEFHEPPFQDEIIKYAEIASNGKVFDLYGGDGTYGEILLSHYPELLYFYFDIDDKALTVAKARLEGFGDRVKIKKFNSRDLEKRILIDRLGEIDCIIYDPGLRREYVENPDRGFIVKESGPLDGRFDQSEKKTMADIVNYYSADELRRVFKVVDVPFPGRIIRRIEEKREMKKILTTTELAEIVSKSTPGMSSRKKGLIPILVMLALRIHLNDEINALQESLTKGLNALRIGGRLLTISWHSGEARTYKKFARTYDERYADDDEKKLRILTRKAVKPSPEAINRNSYIRSAQFRAYEKIG